MENRLRQECMDVLEGNADMLSPRVFKTAIKTIKDSNIDYNDDLSHENIARVIFSHFGWDDVPNINDDEDVDVDMNQIREQERIQLELQQNRVRQQQQADYELQLKCANIFTNRMQNVPIEFIDNVKGYLHRNSISFNERNNLRALCGNVLENMPDRERKPIGAFANEIISKDIEMRERIERERVEAEERRERERLLEVRRIEKETRINAIKILNEQLPECNYHNDNVFLQDHQYIVQERIELREYARNFGLPHEFIISVDNRTFNNFQRDERLNNPLIELRSPNGLTTFARIAGTHENVLGYDDDSDNGTIKISPHISADLQGTPTVSLKICNDVKVPARLMFVVFDGGSMPNQELKARLNIPLQNMLSTYVGLKVGMTIDVVIHADNNEFEDKIVTVVLEKIIDEDQNNVSACQILLGEMSVRYTVRTEEEAFDIQNNLIPSVVPPPTPERDENAFDMGVNMGFDIGEGMNVDGDDLEDLEGQEGGWSRWI